MNVKNAAAILLFSKQEIMIAIKDGLVNSRGERIKLLATPVGNDFDIADEQIDEFQQQFFDEKKRRIPTKIRRELLIESAYRCANCLADNPLEFHHIKEWSKFPHHTPELMITLCKNCHGKCTNQTIGNIAIMTIKARVASRLSGRTEPEFPSALSWDEISVLIDGVHDLLDADDVEDDETLRLQHISLEEKNKINNMGENYFKMMRSRHQPYFRQIEEFLFDPRNRERKRKYYEIVEEINTQISVYRDRYQRFEEIFLDILNKSKTSGLKGRYQPLSVFLSFTYFRCDTGHK